MISRRDFMKIATSAGITAASAPLWLNATSAHAFSQMTGTYKALIVVTLVGGNDGNNMIVPLDSATYAEYAALRSALAIPLGACIPMSSSSGSPTFGFHPSLQNTASLYNSGNAIAVANVGPLSIPLTKAQCLATPNLLPQALLSHPAGQNQWESASTVALPTTGWGGRMADILVSQSGSLPPVMDAGLASIFTVGNSVQGIAVQSGSSQLVALPSGIESAILAIAESDSASQNKLVAQAAQLRVQALNQQAVIAQAQASGNPLKTVFSNSAFGVALGAIASVINGRSVIGASRQIFYTQQGSYDTHANQLGTQASNLSDLDGGIGAMMAAIQEMGLQNDVLICTHSDFNRTLVGNGTAGTDHAWGNHQLIVGGGIRGGRIIGTIPEPELGGSLDLNGEGTWVPTLSVTQMTAAIGSWMGLSGAQLATVFPDLSNFAQGAITLT
jgi:uncharacterized protein (DUF1501 family)